MEQLGYNIIWANDISEIACETYRDNLGEIIELGNIADFHDFPSAECLVGCYPCQGFTQGGKRDWGASINYLYQHFDRALRRILPKAFVVENVIGMAFGANRELLNNQLFRFRLAGYRVKWQVLDAQHYGVPQMRRRIFIVGIRSDLRFNYEFPERKFGEGTRRPLMTQRQALAGMPDWPVGEFNEEPFHWYYMSRRRRHDWDEPSPCIVGHWRHVPLHPMSPPLKRITTDKWIFSRKGVARRLAFRECAALQGFPRSFVWNRGSIRDRFQLIGNAVPPPLFQSVVRKLENLW